MTTIACWFNREQEHQSVWVCGDSKITATNNTTLFESSPKVFAVPINCYAPGQDGFFNKLVFNRTLGIAYAGNAIVALTLNSALTSCFSSLITQGAAPPLDEVALFALKLLKLYVQQLGFAAGDRALCEVALVGSCPVERIIKIFHLSPRTDSGELEYQLTGYRADQVEDSFVLLLGADKDRILNNISELRAGRTRDITWWRAPKMAVAAEVESPGNPTIGGHLQLGICNQNGFQIYSICRPYGQGPQAYLSYLGLNVSSDFSQIGPCLIGMPGMT